MENNKELVEKEVSHGDSYAVEYIMNVLQAHYGPEITIVGPMKIEVGPGNSFVILNNEILAINDREIDYLENYISYVFRV